MLPHRSWRSLIALPLVLAACSPSGAPPRGPAGGDLRGEYPAPAVRAVQGQPVASAVPQAGEVLTWTGTEWKGASPQYRPIAAGVFRADGTAAGPVFGGLRLTTSTGSGTQRTYGVFFDAYRQPDASHSYVITVQTLGSSDTTVTIGSFAEQLFALFVRGISAFQLIMLEIKEIRSS